MTSSVRWGIVLGVVMCVWITAEHFLGYYSTDLDHGQYADMAVIVVPIAATFLSVRSRRNENVGKTLSMKEGMIAGMVTTIVSYPISTGFLLLYHRFVNPAWVDYLIDWERGKLLRDNATAATIAAMEEAHRRSAQPGREAIQALVGTLILGLILSLISSVILRRRRATSLT